MRQKYLIQKTDLSYFLVIANHKPSAPDYLKVLPVPDDKLNEDSRWLQIEDVQNPDGALIPTVTINEVQKQIELELDAAAELAQANADAHEAKIRKKLARLDFGRRISAEVAVLNDSKALTPPQTRAFLKDPKIKELSDLASSGSIDTLQATLQTTDVSAFFSASEKQYVLDLIAEFLASE
jgi:hypothetical protein